MALIKKKPNYYQKKALLPDTSKSVTLPTSNILVYLYPSWMYERYIKFDVAFQSIIKNVQLCDSDGTKLALENLFQFPGRCEFLIKTK